VISFSAAKRGAPSRCVQIRFTFACDKFDIWVEWTILKYGSSVFEEEVVMRSIHLRDWYLPKGPNLRLMAISAVYIFSLSLALFLIFSFLGGNGFAESMGGDASLWFLIGGLLVSAVFAVLERKKS
jgi:hypothetical protein